MGEKFFKHIESKIPSRVNKEKVLLNEGKSVVVVQKWGSVKLEEKGTSIGSLNITQSQAMFKCLDGKTIYRKIPEALQAQIGPIYKEINFLPMLILYQRRRGLS